VSTLASWLRGLGRPAVFAHRGASRRGPENSLDALRLAAREGADGVEFDVQRCASGELVVFHDRTLARCTGTLGTITETPLSVLRLLTLDRCAEHFGLPANGERIPTLEEWLATAPEGLFLNLEVKVETVAESVIAGACIDALERAGRGGHAVVSSFQPAALLRVTHRAPDRGALVESGRGWRSRLAAGILSRPAAVHPEAVLVDAARVRLWHGLGYKVATWTVDEPDELRRVLDAGVDAVITNRPDIARPIVELYRRA
jgi:glycerophosphoryl diester phosphodiesterase